MAVLPKGRSVYRGSRKPGLKRALKKWFINEKRTPAASHRKEKMTAMAEAPLSETDFLSLGGAAEGKICLPPEPKAGAEEGAEKVVLQTKSVPQRLKPHCKENIYGTAEAVPLSETDFLSLGGAAEGKICLKPLS